MMNLIEKIKNIFNKKRVGKVYFSYEYHFEKGDKVTYLFENIEVEGKNTKTQYKFHIASYDFDYQAIAKINELKDMVKKCKYKPKHDVECDSFELI